MAVRPVDFVLRHLRKLIGTTGGAPQTDRQLLERFADGGEESAFATLVERHGPIVWGVCSRILGDTPDADDAFQATFLVLVRRAGTVPWRESVAGWLHSVAQRIAVKARAAAARRRSITAQVADMIQSDSSTEVDRQDLRQVIDEELRRLPAKYREPLVLCYLKGMTHQEAARELGWPAGSLAKRLDGARERLRDRLSARGLALSATLVTSVLQESAAPACVPARLLETTIKSALLYAGGQAAGTEVVSSQVATLAEGALRAMSFTKLKIAAVLGVFVCMLGAGAGALVYQAEADKPAAEARNDSPAAARPKAAAVAAEPWDLPDDKTLPWGQEVGGLACRVVVGEQTYTTGQPIRLAIQIRNNSKRTRWLCRDFTLPTVIGPDGKEIRRPPVAGPRQTRFAQWQPLEPGAVMRVDYADLRPDFPVDEKEQGCRVRKDGFHPQGKYTLSYSYRCDKMPERFFEGIRPDGAEVYAEASEAQLAGAWQGTLLSNTVSFEVRPLKAEDLTVHEWGVFSVFSEQKYANVNRNAEWGDLPNDFYRQFPQRRLVWVPAMNRKPIIYFYTKLPQMHVKATVCFAEGAPVVWWPACTSPADHQHGSLPKDKVFDTLSWDCLLGANLVLPEEVVRGFSIGGLRVESMKVQEFDLPKASWVADARLPDAALITVHGSNLKRTERMETERFLFYDGLVRAPDYLRCVKVADDAITVKNTAAFAIGQLFVVDRRSQRRDRGWAVGHQVAAIPPGGEIEIPTEAAQGAGTLQRLHASVHKALLDAGLFAAEADSLLKIWHKDLLEAGGVTAFYVLPQAEYERMLPLEIQVGNWAVTRPAPGIAYGAVSLPRPASPPVRVGIAHHPHFEMGPQVRQQVAELIRQLAAEDFATREAATRMLLELGPWAAPQIQETLKLKNNLDTTRRLERVLKNADASEWLRQVGPPEKKEK